MYNGSSRGIGFRREVAPTPAQTTCIAGGGLGSFSYETRQPILAHLLVDHAKVAPAGRGEQMNDRLTSDPTVILNTGA